MRKLVVSILILLLAGLVFASRRVTYKRTSERRGELMVFDQPASFSVAHTETPEGGSDPGFSGQWAWDSDYFYICISENTWRRTALGTWGYSRLKTVDGNWLLDVNDNYVRTVETH